MEKLKISILMLVTIVGSHFQSPTIRIGTLDWTTNNLNVTRFKNGDPIQQAQSRAEWEKAGDKGLPAWCYVEGEGAGQAQEILYNWYAVNDSRGLAPEGFRVATEEDWTNLANALGGPEVAGGKLRENGFNVTPSGWRKGYGAQFTGGGYSAHWWANTEINGSGRTFTIQNHNTILSSAAGSKGYGRSVRCVKE